MSTFNIVQAKKQNAEFAELVEKQKTVDRIANRKKRSHDGDGSDSAQDQSSNTTSKQIKRQFRQAGITSKQHGEGGAKVGADVLSAVFVGKT